MQEPTKGADPHPARNGFVPRPVDVARPYDNEWDPKSLTVFPNELILLRLGEAVSVALALGTRTHWRSLIQYFATGFVHVAVDCK